MALTSTNFRSLIDFHAVFISHVGSYAFDATTLLHFKAKWHIPEHNFAILCILLF